MGSNQDEIDVYTILLIIAAAFIIIATVIMAWKFGANYGFENLFQAPMVIKEG
jgi:hypothetical protein